MTAISFVDSPRPSRFGFRLHFPDLRDAIDVVRMTGEGETVEVLLSSQMMSLARERNGVLCAADIPIRWDSTPWSEAGLLFKTNITLFDRLLRKDVEWSTVLISGAYPGAALGESDNEKTALWRIQVEGITIPRRSEPGADDEATDASEQTREDIELFWPLHFVRSAEPARPILSDDAQVVDPRALSQAIRLLSQVAAPEAQRRGVFESATIGDRRARVTGRAARTIMSEALDLKAFNLSCKHLVQLGSLLDRMPADTRLSINGDLVTFASSRAHFSFKAGALASWDLSEWQQRPPLTEVETTARDLSSAINKIVAQTREKSDCIWWRMAGGREIQLILDVPGGAAVVTFSLPDGQHEQVPSIDYRFTAQSLSMLTPLPRANTTTLVFHPNHLASRQVQEDLTVTTYIQEMRGR